MNDILNAVWEGFCKHSILWVELAMIGVALICAFIVGFKGKEDNFEDPLLPRKN